jgi:hypothetical protein
VVASGLSPRTAHYLGRPDFFASFGWSEGDVPDVTDAERAAYAGARALTDRLLVAAHSVLDAPSASAFGDGVERLAAAHAAA